MLDEASLDLYGEKFTCDEGLDRHREDLGRPLVRAERDSRHEWSSLSTPSPPSSFSWGNSPSHMNHDSGYSEQMACDNDPMLSQQESDQVTAYNISADSTTNLDDYYDDSTWMDLSDTRTFTTLTVAVAEDPFVLPTDEVENPSLEETSEVPQSADDDIRKIVVEQCTVTNIVSEATVTLATFDNSPVTTENSDTVIELLTNDNNAEVQYIECEVVQLLDDCFVPEVVWNAARREIDSYQSGKKLFNYLFSDKECQNGTTSGRNNKNKLKEKDKLCPKKQLAIIRALAWLKLRSEEQFYPSEPVVMMSSAVIKNLIKKIFTEHRNQRNMKNEGRRTKKKQTIVRTSDDEAPPLLTDDDESRIEWANNSFITRNVWAEAFIQVLVGNISSAATILFDALFSEQEQLVSTLKGTLGTPKKAATLPLDLRRCNGIMLICRWMTNNTGITPYTSFITCTEEELKEFSPTEEENLKIRKVFIDRPNQRRQDLRRKGHTTELQQDDDEPREKKPRGPSI